MARTETKILASLTALTVAILMIAGRFTPQVLPDTPGYLRIVGYPAMLAQPRTPLYGWLVAVLDLGGTSHVAIPAFQVVTYLAAVWLLVGQLRRYGLSPAATLSIGTGLLLANAFLIDASWVHPELLSITCGLLAIAGTIELVDAQPRQWAWLLVCAGAGCAYVLRPSFLMLVIALPALHVVLRAVRGGSLQPARAAAIVVAAAAPFIGIATLRAATVGDANVVSFGGFAMSGMATLLLSDETLPKLPEDVRPYAAGVLAARHAGEDSGHLIGIPLNAGEQRSFYSAALAYFDVLARTHDDMVFQIIAPTRRPGESWVDFNRRLTRFSLAVVRASPGHYAAWIVGAATRVMGHALVTNLPAALAMLAIGIAWPWRLFTSGEVSVTPVTRLDFPVLAVLAFVWLIGAGTLTMLMIAPVLRYIDTASIMIGPIFIYWAALLVLRNFQAPAAVSANLSAPTESTTARQRIIPEKVA